MRRRTRWGLAAVVVATVAASTCWVGAVRAGATAPATSSPFTATGYFHTAEVGGRWWLVTPDGHPFYSSGIDHVSASPDTDRTTGQCPYCITVAATYPSYAAWAKTTVTRLESWGFNTLGSWSDSQLHADMPYTVLLDMASGNDWFASSFVTHADAVAANEVAPLADDPNLVGWYTDSELPWGPGPTTSQTALARYLALPAGTPGRAVADRYVGDPGGFLQALATRYFSVTTAAIHAVDPHHLVLGVKAISQLIRPQLLEAARPYVDVFSVDDYTLTQATTSLIHTAWPQYLRVDHTLAAIERIWHKPVMVGEYSFRAGQSPDPNTWPPIYPTVATQGQRAAELAAYVDQLHTSAPWVVGDEWFEYVDEPAGGRFDGENSNFGVVSTKDVPYGALVRRMTLVHATAPDRLLEPGGRCIRWASGGTGVPACTHWLSASAMGDPGPAAGGGYWLAANDGSVVAFGDAGSYGSMGGHPLNAPVVGLAATPDGRGYWLAAADGGVFAFGDARFFGSMGGHVLNKPVVAIATDPSGEGYWLAAKDGGVFAFGDAPFLGSMGATSLNAPVVAVVATADGNGYWLVGADGGVFAFGDAAFFGSMGARHLAAPVVAAAASPDGNGYWLVGADGGVFAFGDARFDGSLAARPLAARVTGIAGTPTGYRLVAADGGVFAEGGASFEGASLRRHPAVVGLAA